ncbi:MAG: NAD-dependent epimerase/dehydratase family protein [Clostridia bacterium]|nr:NAD-dependent epimerase/dehydratase family protein [Clostridia bacterium]
MNILVTGAKGFIGRNLCENLKNIRDGKDKTRPSVAVEDIYEYDVDCERSALEAFCAKADFVFHLAGVNRPKDPSEFKKGNVDFSAELLEILASQKSRATVVLSSSVQATLTGRFGVSDYGLSKKECEEAFFKYAQETANDVYVYRFPNVAGKWARPNYNSAVVTFCYNVARGLPVTVNDRATVLDLLFVDDLVNEFIDFALAKKPHRCGFEGTEPVPDENGRYCYVPTTYKASLGEIYDALAAFKDFPKTLTLPDMPSGSFMKKLISTYISYLPEEGAEVKPEAKTDARGSFSELIKNPGCGQVSINVTNPGEIKGLHWHNLKWEIFTVVSGTGLIRQRQIGSDKVIETRVSGDDISMVFMLPGYTHSIENTSKSEKLVTLMYANEIFDSERPDTFREPV